MNLKADSKRLHESIYIACKLLEVNPSGIIAAELNPRQHRPILFTSISSRMFYYLKCELHKHL